jgi:hypothetical protein
MESELGRCEIRLKETEGYGQYPIVSWFQASTGLAIGTIPPQRAKMVSRSIALILISVLLAGCASYPSAGYAIAEHIPTWLGGMPNDVPPRPGTPEYDAWQKQRAEEAARPKSK